jgi:hypothetical protein
MNAYKSVTYAEGYLPIEDHGLIGDFPQAFSHVGLISSAVNLARLTAPRKNEKRQD